MGESFTRCDFPVMYAVVLLLLLLLLFIFFFTLVTILHRSLNLNGTF